MGDNSRVLNVNWVLHVAQSLVTQTFYSPNSGVKKFIFPFQDCLRFHWWFHHFWELQSFCGDLELRKLTLSDRFKDCL